MKKASEKFVTPIQLSTQLLPGQTIPVIAINYALAYLFPRHGLFLEVNTGRFYASKDFLVKNINEFLCYLKTFVHTSNKFPFDYPPVRSAKEHLGDVGEPTPKNLEDTE